MITLALIGVGSWGKNYLKTVEGIDTIKIGYIAARDKKRLENFDPKYIKITDYKELIHYKDIDGVIIATPVTSHHAIAKFFIQHDIPVLIEKPLTNRLKDALSLLKIHQNHKKSIVMVGHLFVYHSAVIKIKEYLNKIGRIVYMYGEGCDWGPFRKDTSALWDWAPHDISILLSLMRILPKEVRAWSVQSTISGSDTHDMIMIKLLYEQNVRAFIRIGWLSPIKRREFNIVGEKGALVFDDMKDKKITVFEGNNLEKATYPTYDKMLPLERQIRVFVSCIQNRMQPETDLIHAVKTIKVIDSIERSLAGNGKVIKVNTSLTS